MKVEFLLPHCLTTKVQPKFGRNDVCFCPLEDIIMKLMRKASPVQSRTREVYSIAHVVKDFIACEHV